MTARHPTSGLTLGGVIAQARGDVAHLPISGITSDSRRVRPGDIFVALAGSRTDGRRFVADAVARGAAVIVAETERPADLSPAQVPVQIPWLRVEDARRALALAAAQVHPRQPAVTVAVTGTSGKSSVADFTRQIFEYLGHPSASLGTVGIVTARGADHGALTTPDPVDLHRSLDRLAGEGITHLALEASSHGLDQRRLDGVRFSAGAFLNLGRDHLDYHETVEAYLAAKLRLWRLLPAGAPAIINADAAEADSAGRAARAAGLAVFGFGQAGADLRLTGLAREGFGQRLTLVHAGRLHEVRLPLAGDFMASNALAAASLALALGEDPVAVMAALTGLRGVPGRLDQVGEHRGGIALVDYAHKPDALSAVLDTLRGFASGPLICVVGCGGDRDRGKRPLMGAIAAAKADLVIITDDNPRSEDPATIRAQMLAGIDPAVRGHVLEIGARDAAIAEAVRRMTPGCVLVVAGKGHEQGQIIGDRVEPFSDHAHLRQAMAADGADLSADRE